MTPEPAAQPQQEFAIPADDLGPGAALACRFLSTYPEYFAPSVRQALLRVQDRTLELPWSAVRLVIGGDLRAAPEMLFDWIDKRPFRSSYLAQYHRARTAMKIPVVVKISRPGIRERAIQEVGASTFATLLKRFPPEGNSDLAPAQLEAAWKLWIDESLDYPSQARHLSSLHRLSSGFSAHRYPKVYAELCGPGTLVTEDLHGLSVLEAVDSGTAEPAAISGLLVEGLAEQLLECPYVVDAHPESVLWLSGGVLGIVEADHVHSIGEPLREHIAACVRALSAGDVEELHRRLMELSRQSDPAGVTAFNAWLADSANRPAAPAAVIAELLNTARANGIEFEPVALAILRTATQTSELAAGIAPEADVRAAFRRAVTRRQVRDAMQSLRPERLLSQADDILALLRDGPSQVRRLLQHLEEERLRLPALVTQSAADRVAANRRSKLQALCFVAVALTLLLGVLSQVPWLARPFVYGIVIAALAAAYAGIVLLWSSLD